MPFLLELLALLGLLLLSAFFSGSETALFSLSDLQLQALENGSARERRARELVLRPRRTLVTILLANMIVNVLISVILTSLCLRWFGPRGLAIAIAVATVLLLLFGEIVPKSFGLRRSQVIAVASSVPLTALSWLLGPIRRALEAMADAITGGRQSQPLTKDELPTLVDVARDGGEISRFESRVLRRVLRFADTPLSRCMTPRVEMIAVPSDMPVSAALEVFEESGRSRLPISGESSDEIIGVLLLKDVLTQPGSLDGLLARDLAREVLHEPETLPATTLFRRFQSERIHLAVIVGEHGGVEGLVTLEDLLEELVGDIRDESDEQASELEQLADGSFRGDASIEVEEAAEALGLDISPTDEDAVTFSGVLQHELGRIPVRGDEIEWRGYRIRVLTASANRARLIRLAPEDKR